MAPEEDEDDILGAEYDRREFREMCELFGFDVSPPGTPEEPAAAPAPAPAARPPPDDAAEVSDAEARAYWAARDRAGGEATDATALCRARARKAHAPVEPTELGLAKDQRVVVLRAELLATPGWVFADAGEAFGYVPRTYLQPVPAGAAPAPKARTAPPPPVASPTPAEAKAAAARPRPAARAPPTPEAKAAAPPPPAAPEAKAAPAAPPAALEAKALAQKALDVLDAIPKPAARPVLVARATSEAKAAAAPPPPAAAEPKAAAPGAAAAQHKESKGAGVKRKSKREAVREEIRARNGKPVPRRKKFGNNRAALAAAPPAVQAEMRGTLRRAATEARATIKRNDDIVAATLRRTQQAGASPLPRPSAFFARRRESEASLASPAPSPPPPTPGAARGRRPSTSPDVLNGRRESGASMPPTPPGATSPATVGDAAAAPTAPAERWAKFWEPTQRCFYFVSDASGESRWAAHFDDDVMVVETEDEIKYVHHATLEPVDGPAEAAPNAEGTTAQDVCNWQTMIDPVSGQVYYYSRASGASRWTPPTWMDYYDPTEQCVYYIHRTSGESSWEEPAGFRDEADAEEVEEAEDVAVEEEEDAKETYEAAAVDAGAAKARVMFSYRKRPTAPWDPHGRTMRGTLKRQAASPGVVPSRKLQFGDTLVLGDIIAELD